MNRSRGCIAAAQLGLGNLIFISVNLVGTPNTQSTKNKMYEVMK